MRRHLTYANVMSTIAVFVALGGVSAYAAPKLINGKKIKKGTIQSKQVKDGSLAEVDLASAVKAKLNRAIPDVSSLRDGCPIATARYGRICAGTAGGPDNFNNATILCAALHLRLPSYGEAIVLARDFDVPGVSGTQQFWTDADVSAGFARTTDEDGTIGSNDSLSNLHQDVCVTDVTNTG